MPEIKNLKKAAKRIEKAIVAKERIILYGDADIDGASSVVILQEAIEICRGGVSPPVETSGRETRPVETSGRETRPVETSGRETRPLRVAVYFPSREKEGYGINKNALNYLADKAPGLLIALDCGMGQVEEVVLAKKMGFEVMIIDHHQVPPGALPDASIVVNPKQNGDGYPFKHLACAAIVYKLVRILLGQKENWQPEKFLGLVALAILADKMPLIGENQSLVNQGILSLSRSERLGMQMLMQEVGFKPPSTLSLLRAADYVAVVCRKLLPVLNSAEVKGHINQAYALLRERSAFGAKKRIKALQERAIERKEQINRAFQEVESRVLTKGDGLLIFEGEPWWPLIYLGAMASRVCQRFGRPTFLFQKQKFTSRGAVRMPKGMDGVKAMTYCSEFLEGYGGHAPAAGFTIKNENLEKFRQCLIRYFQGKQGKL